MRDVKRIEPFCKKLQKFWETRIPDWRFGQFMCNFLGWVYEKTKTDVFFLEDDVMEKYLDEYLSEQK